MKTLLLLLISGCSYGQLMQMDFYTPKHKKAAPAKVDSAWIISFTPDVWTIVTRNGFAVDSFVSSKGKPPVVYKYQQIESCFCGKYKKNKDYKPHWCDSLVLTIK